ncbi:hypothetical protein AB0368_31940 [Actinoplanes sp. NPDC051475]|uniref:hypothetical protein n=1 Tax=Actinoplanes sp. NPDC051475 TaxID=3157225 RepID=UPI00344B9E96
MSLISVGFIAFEDWRTLHARSFFREHRGDFVTVADMASRGAFGGDIADGPLLPEGLGYLSGKGQAASMILQENGKRVLFLPAGKVRGCAAGYVYPGLELAFDVYDGCASRMPMADGWYWTD